MIGPTQRCSVSKTLIQKGEAEATRWITDPIYWGHKFLASEAEPWDPSPLQLQLWDAYKRLVTAKVKRYTGEPLTSDEEAIVNKQGISVMAGQGLGKEATIAPIGLHWQMCMKEPKVVCTAPAGPTLFSTLWPEFAKWINRSRYLPHILTKQSDKIFRTDRGPEPYWIKPRTIQANSSPDEQGEVLRGIHSTSMLYLVTEASGVPEGVWKPLEGGLTDPIAMIILIFNPTRNSGFAIETQRKFRNNWICLHWDGEEMARIKREHPGRFLWFNENYLDVLKSKYGAQSNAYRISGRGLPPLQAEDTLIGWDDMMDATERTFEYVKTDPVVIACDVAGEGADKTIILVRRGPTVVKIHEHVKRDATDIAYLIMGCFKDYVAMSDDPQNYAVGVDVIGLGHGVYSQLIKIHGLKKVYPIDVSKVSSNQERYHRLRDEIFWMLREVFADTRLIAIPKDDELFQECTTIKWKEELGKIKVEGKDKLAARGLPSPNKADALAMSEYLIRRCTSQVPAGVRKLQRQRPRQSSWRTV